MDSIFITLSTAIYTIFADIAVKTIARIARPVITEQLLFEGEIRDEFKSKEVFQLITSRYKDSIDDVNRKVGFAITFTLIALYVYFILPETESVKIPLIDLSVSRQIWISVAPAISYGLQVLVITSFLWFMVLRAGLKILVIRSRDDSGRLELVKTLLPKSKRKSTTESISKEPKVKKKDSQDFKEAFADLTNILLKGVLGDFWMIFRIRKIFESRWHYFWYFPLLLLVFLLALSPGLISLFFTYQLFAIGNIGLGITYTLIFFPVSILLLILIGMVGLLGATENMPF